MLRETAGRRHCLDCQAQGLKPGRFLQMVWLRLEGPVRTRDHQQEDAAGGCGPSRRQLVAAQALYRAQRHFLRRKQRRRQQYEWVAHLCASRLLDPVFRAVVVAVVFPVFGMELQTRIWVPASQPVTMYLNIKWNRIQRTSPSCWLTRTTSVPRVKSLSTRTGPCAQTQ